MNEENKESMENKEAVPESGGVEWSLDELAEARDKIKEQVRAESEGEPDEKAPDATVRRRLDRTAETGEWAKELSEADKTDMEKEQEVRQREMIEKWKNQGR